MPFTQNDIIEQLSYAYLHAVAAASGFACEVVVSRLVDGAGVDARLSWKERLDEASVHTNSDVRIQLKATTKTPPKENGRFSYYLKDVEKYDELRVRSSSFPTLLVVLFLPQNAPEWLTLNHEALPARRCAYWVSLWDAPKTANRSGVTVYLPEQNILTPANLRELVRQFSPDEDVVYGG